MEEGEKQVSLIFPLASPVPICRASPVPTPIPHLKTRSLSSEGKITFHLLVNGLTHSSFMKMRKRRGKSVQDPDVMGHDFVEAITTCKDLKKHDIAVCIPH